MNAGNFLGMPYKVSNQIPTDSKTGCTEMFFGNWADLMIGDQMGLETYTTLDGTWTDENGVQHNAFEENLTGTRALMYDDIACAMLRASPTSTISRLSEEEDCYEKSTV